MAEFFDMGGYAAFIWPTYGVAALVMVVLLIASLRGLRASTAELESLEQAQGPGRRRRRGQGA